MLPVPATCQISIRGAFDVPWTDYLGDTLQQADVQTGDVRTTTLCGTVPDLAAFIGALSLLADMGLSVTACEFNDIEPEAAHAGPR